MPLRTIAIRFGGSAGQGLAIGAGVGGVVVGPGYEVRGAGADGVVDDARRGSGATTAATNARRPGKGAEMVNHSAGKPANGNPGAACGRQALGPP